MGWSKFIEPFFLKSDKTLHHPVDKQIGKTSSQPSQLHPQDKPQIILWKLFHSEKTQKRGIEDRTSYAFDPINNKKTTNRHKEMREKFKAKLQKETELIVLIIITLWSHAINITSFNQPIRHLLHISHSPVQFVNAIDKLRNSPFINFLIMRNNCRIAKFDHFCDMRIEVSFLVLLADLLGFYLLDRSGRGNLLHLQMINFIYDIKLLI